MPTAEETLSAKKVLAGEITSGQLPNQAATAAAPIPSEVQLSLGASLITLVAMRLAWRNWLAGFRDALQDGRRVSFSLW
ncbi:MAG TPA: hypothetical protein VKP30_13210 [Polyangiaceae bacterium]|nr:hypothetical protein [Polyangiaceae bacterium]